MRNRTAPGISVAIVLSAGAAVVAVRAATRRPEPRRVLVAEHAPVTVAADESQPAGAGAQMQHVFHELHADGRHALCAVCESRYWSG